MWGFTDFKKSRSPFIIKEVYTDLCIFLFFLKKLILIKLGLSRTCSANFRKEGFKGLKEKVDNSMTCNSVTEKENSKFGKVLKCQIMQIEVISPRKEKRRNLQKMRWHRMFSNEFNF